MPDDDLPKDELEKYRIRASEGGGDRSEKRRRMRVDSGATDDESVFNRIMRAVRKVERETGCVPSLSTLAKKTGTSKSRIRQILSKYLSDGKMEGDTEFASSLKDLVLDNGYFFVAHGVISPEEWAQVQTERETTGDPIPLILSRMGLVNENQLKIALEIQSGVTYLDTQDD